MSVQTILTVTIPLTPDKCLSPNNIRSERHWGPRHRATQSARLAACRSAQVAGAHLRPWVAPITLHAVIAWERGRRCYDPDSAHAMCKPLIDGIADAIGVDDKHITLATVAQIKDPAKSGWVRVVIEQGDEHE